MHMLIVTGFTVIFETINIHQRPFTIGWFRKKGGHGMCSLDQALQQQATGAQQRQEKAVKLLRDPISVGWWGSSAVVES